MAETKKYVRIKKASYRSLWYADKIGRIFPSLGTWGNAYKVDSPDRALYIRKEDAQLIVTEKRPAKVGERVLITEAYAYTGCPYKNGDINNVKTADKHGHILVEEHSVSLIRREYEVIVNNEVENEEADGMESVNKTAIDSASTVFEKVGEDYIGSKSRFGDILIGSPYSEAFVKAYANERKDVLVIPQTFEYTAFLHNEEMKKVAKSEQEAIKDRAQARRDEIVEQAKADVEELKECGRTHAGKPFDYRLKMICVKSEFIVNRDKRTVVVLLKGAGNKFIYSRGIAKAAPDDCFNVHIGKAIALRRALGLAVPDEYLNAPQPTEVRVGDVIEVTLDSGEIEKKPVISLKAGSLNAHLPGRIVQYPSHYAKIIDDSREEVGE
ncbi:hypothetical protein [Bacillus velezensis]|uniref:hypothetical protein n=1 Tax=Bacillus velezensis TaxID=492670 RepID=UPI001CF950A1|nr:hypothetical protein [Bacillus velezensis]GJI61787.1 hypothetical protein BVSY1_09430 [Bacillus velezensis]